MTALFKIIIIYLIQYIMNLKLLYTLILLFSITVANILAQENFNNLIINTDSINNDTINENIFSDFVESVEDINLEMVAIKGGTFNMGGKIKEDEQVIHKVLVDDFYIGKFEITQKQWLVVMGYNPSKNKGEKLPVEQVSWKQVQLFLVKLNTLTKKTYRLPTEAEWEYSARAGTTSNFNTGDCLISSQANYNANYPLKNCTKGEYRKKEIPVGSFLPNNWGLYDMHGNVWEWCNDWYGENYYNESPQNNPKGPNSGTHRVIRGGGWGYFASGCRSANRGFYGTTISFDDIGFRVVY